MPERRSRGPIPTPARKRETKVEPTARPAPEAAPSLAKPKKLPQNVGTGPLTEALAYEQAQITVAIKVRVKSVGKKLNGVLLRVGMSNCFVACPGIAAGEIAPNERVDVRLKIDLRSRVYSITLCCRLLIFGLDPLSEREGMILTIRAVDQPKSPGLFERYIKYLYYQMINEA